ncbi:MAG: hypothetical protein IPK80_03645 [Nannocystis sp.]|nr:hypothetical protein [Nannocystis sp.]
MRPPTSRLRLRRTKATTIPPPDDPDLPAPVGPPAQSEQPTRRDDPPPPGPGNLEGENQAQAAA